MSALLASLRVYPQLYLHPRIFPTCFCTDQITVSEGGQAATCQSRRSRSRQRRRQALLTLRERAGQSGIEEDALFLGEAGLPLVVWRVLALGTAGAAGRPGEAARPASWAGAARRHTERAAA
jgi:hypothetical protein